MTRYQLLSKRVAMANARALRIDVLPTELRVQVTKIWERALPAKCVVKQDGKDLRVWDAIELILSEEHGKSPLWVAREPYHNVKAHFQYTTDVNKALDVIELSFRILDNGVRRDDSESWLRLLSPDDAIAKLNQRFQEHAIGYRYTSGYLVRTDSEYLHAEAVAPALFMLADSRFRGAQDEFLKAERLYRTGEHKGALNEACKAFESTMKVICDQRSLPYSAERATAAALVKALMDGGLIPPYLDSAIGALRTLLTSLVPTIRNKEGAHGQGAEIKEVPHHLAAYALHVTASTIVMLVEAHRANP